MFSNSETYFRDKDLFKNLGFDLFNVNHQKEFKVGEYKLDDYDTAKITVFVKCMPAQFWRFEIQTDENISVGLETGSGTLSDYWNIALQFAKGMVVFCIG